MRISGKNKGGRKIDATETFDAAMGRWMRAAMNATSEAELSHALGQLDYLRGCASMFAHLDALAVLP